MAMPFAGLARARAKMLEGGLRGEQERYERDTTEQARVFREWATRKQLEETEKDRAYTRDRLTALDAERRTDRDQQASRQREQDQLKAIDSGGEDAPEMVASQLLAGLNAMRGSGGNTAFRAPKPTTPAHTGRVGEVSFDAPTLGTTYGTSGGRTFRFDRQKGANAAMQDEQRKAQLEQQRDERNFGQQRQLAAESNAATLQAIGARQGGGGGGGGGQQGGMPPADNRDEMPLRKEFNQEITRHTQIAPALAKIEESARMGTGQGDMGIIYGFMRMQDPGSTVREGEYATAQNSAGVEEQARQTYNRLLTGEKLAPEVRAKFVEAARRLAQTEREGARQLVSRYAQLATRYGIPAEAVVYDPYDSVLGMYQGAGKPGVGPDGKPFGQGNARRPLSQVVGGVR